MKIAIDVSPLASGHKVRGVGFYLKYLKDSLIKNFPKEDYIFFTKPEEIPQKLDVLHFPYFDPFFLTLPLKKRAKTIVTVHDLTPLVFPKAFPAGLKGRLRWQLQKFALRRVDGIITDSHSSRKDIIALTGVKSQNVHVVYLAAGKEFTKVTRERAKEVIDKYHLPEFFLLYVGDVTWNKNLPRLLDAVAQADIPLVMIGKALVEVDFDHHNPWNADRIAIKEKADNNPHVFRLGFLPTEDVVALYNAATALVLPSLYEGFGLPIIEAMSCGTPVITSQRGSLPEVAGDAAYYINPDDTNDMIKGIKEVFTNKKLQDELTKKGFIQAKRFSWEKAAKETFNIYER